jgi:asparagine synthase (glutamine-hydrolysing)
MCGIAGILRFGGEGQDLAAVERMLERLARRGPDDTGTQSCGALTLGHRRLAILDRTQAAHQPMTSASGRYVVTFNGEIYNYRELCRELAVDPRSLRSSSDTEVLLLAWERWGTEALSRFVGQWAFAMYDTVERHLWLARDRFGEKPLYFHTSRERVAFASSIAALVEAPGVPRELDSQAIGEYLTLRYVVSPRTVVRDVRKLSPGHWLRFGADGSTHEAEWYTPRFRPGQSSRKSREAPDEEFGALFTQACERCLISDVPVGLLLSDGIDSNGIAAALAIKGHTPPSFTFRLKNPRAGIQPDVVRGYGGEIIDIETTAAERCSAFDSAFASLTEPVGDGASLASWMVVRGARSRATVLLRARRETRCSAAIAQPGSFSTGDAAPPRACPRTGTGSHVRSLPAGRARARSRSARSNFSSAHARAAPEAARYLVDRRCRRRRSGSYSEGGCRPASPT